MPEQFHGKYNHGNNKKENRQPVYAMHVLHPLGRLVVRIFFYKVQILAYLL